MTMPLFPLGTVLFPGGYLPIRIFETRYIDMVSHCMKQGCDFGVCLINEGQEVGEPAVPYTIGTMARIIDWGSDDDGLLSITVMGTERFRVIENTLQDNNLITAHTQVIEPEIENDYYLANGSEQERETWTELTKVLEIYMESVKGEKTLYHEIKNDPHWVSYRLAELLTIPLPAKQELLELGVAERISRITSWAKELKWI
ncbi:Uncharacterized protein, similar to the N-terminal domain of Lon protease [hydrothermal vent metagenome]|uniref:Uncharacterized protein, similar to the N-terminal domain of Lon protease n=1 Tax=hydrothermal vent metagenome TaxID=652676 RepID=A0A3B0YMS0_9ZZZZ